MFFGSSVKVKRQHNDGYTDKCNEPVFFQHRRNEVRRIVSVAHHGKEIGSASFRSKFKELEIQSIHANAQNHGHVKEKIIDEMIKFPLRY